MSLTPRFGLRLHAAAVLLASGLVGCTGSAPSGNTGGAGNAGGATATTGAGGEGTGGIGGASAGSVGGRGAAAGTSGAAGAPSPFTGALAGCVRDIFGTYVLRGDGIALHEPSANNEHVVVDAATALPLTGIVAIQGGSNHGCAVLQDGSVSCWQVAASSGNGSGQLGNGTTMQTAVVYRSTPVLAAAGTPLAKVIGFAAGAESTQPFNATCVVTSDKKMWCWGDLSWIVNGGKPLSSPYAQAITLDGIAPLTGVIQATYGGTGACALTEGAPNGVWCWGINSSSELGQGDTLDRQYPVRVLGLTAPTRVVLTDAYTNNNAICALDGDSLKCWGDNRNGTIGVGGTATTSILSPTPVVIQSGAPLTGIADIRTGTAAFGVLRTDHTLWAWGQSFTRYAGNYGLTDILAIGYVGGYLGNGPRFLTSDGIYHNAMTPMTVNCNPLQ